MPNKDGTGPEGKGSKTGRAQGNCNRNKDKPNTMGLGLRRRANQ